MQTPAGGHFEKGVMAPPQVSLGDAQGLHIYRTQPEKLAAIESHWNTNPRGSGAAFNILAWPDPDGGRNVFEVQTTFSSTGFSGARRPIPPTEKTEGPRLRSP